MAKIKSIVSALALVAAASPAFAGCDNTSNLGDLGAPGLATFGNTFAAAGTYTDCYTFDLLGNANSFGGVAQSVDLFGWNKLGIDVTSVALWGGTLGSTLTDSWLSDGFNFAGLGTGHYTLAVSSIVDTNWGWYTSKVGYAGAILTVSAVPEPQTYALMLLGLAAIGMFARRRQQPR
jgi:hypothetical protein